jgi:hypothetical protein
MKRTDKASRVDLNALNLRSGAYLVKVKTDKKVYSGKILIEQ